MPKQSRLSDDAMIYQPRKKRTEKEKLQEMSFKEKSAYVWEYYKFHILGTIAAVALIIYFINSVLHPNASPQFYAAMINNTISEDVLQEYSTDFAAKLSLDPERENIELNTNFNFGSTDTQFTMGMQEVLMAHISSNEIDVIIAPEDIFDTYAHNGYFSSLSDKLPTDIYSSLTDQFYITNTQDDTEKYAYGIYLNDTKLYKENSIGTKPYLLGILANSKHDENTIEFIRYLFKEN